ncbi:hypothetical protein L484_011949 [Morus notabilis]|uniref:Uncharacterized protein n=1 Tax=Morus notabilis TaxID=981085 RepID=W9S2D6_9ROSA|nr:uncharacterized protein LOC21395186 [Morus notabilis]EXC22225.1 hypothetical protein L484_011949 [Morus notabilis]
MAMAVLRSQDCRGGRFGDESLKLTAPFRSRRKPNFPILSPNSSDPQSRRRKRSPVGFQSSPQDRDPSRSRYGALVEKAPANNLVMGQVKILKRGETLSLSPARNNRGVGVVAGESNRKSTAKKVGAGADLVLGSTDRLGPDPETVKKQVRVSNHKVVASADGLYAGSGAFFPSPPPSSVPLPAFLGKNDAATTDLRRLLQLDLA